MIAKGKAIAHGGNAIGYAMREDKIEDLLYANCIEGMTPEQIIKEMEAVNAYSPRCKNKYLHFQIGIAPGDRDKLKSSDLRNISLRFAQDMGLQENQ